MQRVGHVMDSGSVKTPEVGIVMELVGDDQSAAWCIVSGGEELHSGAAEGGIHEATKTAVKHLVTIDGFRKTPTYVGHRKLRMLLSAVYPNVIKSPKECSVPQQAVSLARSRAMSALHDMNAKTRQLEAKRERRKAEAKRKRYVENRLMPRLCAAIYAVLPSGDTIAGISWLAEDGRHALHSITVPRGDQRLAELWALAHLLKAINTGRLLRVAMMSKSTSLMFENRKYIIERPDVYPATLIEVLRVLDELAQDRDIIIDDSGKNDDTPCVRTAARLAAFARQLHYEGGESAEQWKKVDQILLTGIGYDRNAARRSKDS